MCLEAEVTLEVLEVEELLVVELVEVLELLVKVTLVEVVLFIVVNIMMPVAVEEQVQQVLHQLLLISQVLVVQVYQIQLQVQQ